MKADPFAISLILVLPFATAAQAQSNFESSKLSSGVVTQGTGFQSPKASPGIVVQGGAFQSPKLSSGAVLQNTAFESPKLSVGVVVQILPGGGIVPRAPLVHW